MSEEIRLKEQYTLARCCSPSRDDRIVGYYSHDRFLKVHRHDCPSFSKVDPARLVPLSWDDILEHDESPPEVDYNDLDSDDIAVLGHHLEYGIDYSLKVAQVLGLDKQAAFDRHHKLRGLGLLQRVEPRIVQYRKGIVDNKWIKHRNHTYYDLTPKGKSCIELYRNAGNR